MLSVDEIREAERLDDQHRTRSRPPRCWRHERTAHRRAAASATPPSPTCQLPATAHRADRDPLRRGNPGRASRAGWSQSPIARVRSTGSNAGRTGCRRTATTSSSGPSATPSRSTRPRDEGLIAELKISKTELGDETLDAGRRRLPGRFRRLSADARRRELADPRQRSG